MKKLKFLQYVVPLLIGFLLAQAVQANSPEPGTAGDPVAGKAYLEKALAEQLGPLEAELKSLEAQLLQKQNPFDDINTSDIWAKNQIIYLYQNKIISGRGDKTFGPKETLKRAEFAKMTLLAAGFDPSKAQVSRFKDVPSAEDQTWQIGYVEGAAANNLVKGDTFGYFKPINPIKREEMAAILVRAMGLEAEAQKRQGETVPFIDEDKVSPWARGYVIIAKEKGLINGIAAGDGNFRFDPAKNASRQEAAKIIYEFLQVK